METLPLIPSDKRLPRAPQEAKLPPVDPIDDDTAEWGMPLMSASARASGTIKVKFLFAGRAKPMPFADPDDEIDENDTSQWNASLIPQPACFSDTISVRIVDKGWSKPVPFADPRDEP